MTPMVMASKRVSPKLMLRGVQIGIPG